MAEDTTTAALKSRYLGRTLQDVPAPAAVLDLAKLEVNCQRMIDATKRLGMLWRPHIKTHKTTELTRLQVGDGDDTPANLVVSTLVEAENIVPLLEEYQSKGRKINILHSFPLPSFAVPRLAYIASRLGPGSVSVMIDHPGQVPLLANLSSASGHPPLVFLKVDTGYRRAGVEPDSPACDALIDALLASEAAGDCVFHGLYSHASHSYGMRDDWRAMELLAAEFLGVQMAAGKVRSRSPGHSLVLSVGATPTATTVQHPGLGDGVSADAGGGTDVGGETTAPTGLLTKLFGELKTDGLELEVHAGVYPTLDLQQLATHARDRSLMTHEDIAFDVLVEVASLYPGRGADGTTEALVTAGCLALGREPVQDKGALPGKDYSGWGMVSPWNSRNVAPGADFPRVHRGWQVGRISQEHGILVWNGEKQEEVPLEVGQRLRIWPNHSCIAGAGFDYYLIVDSRNKGKEDEVIDVWPRWRGW